MKDAQRLVCLAPRRPMGLPEVAIFGMPWLLSVGSGLMMIGVNLRVVELGAGVQFLGLLGFLRSATFLLSSVGLGALSDRLRRRETIVLVSCFVHAVVAFSTAWASSFASLAALAAAFALAEAMLWPPLEAWLGDKTEKGDRRRWLGIFNVGWCSGFAVGSSLTGVIKKMSGILPFYVSAAACFLGGMIATMLPQAGVRMESKQVAQKPERRIRDQRPWMHLSWVANFGNVFCLVAILNLFPKQGNQLHFSESLVAFLCGLVVVGELLAFVFTALTTYWQARLDILAGAQGLAMLGLLWLGLGERVVSFALVFPLVGISIGIGFSSSLLFSVSTEQGKGAKAGTHEGVAALGGLIAPPLGGLLAAFAGRTLPHVLCGLLLAVCVLVEMRMAERSKRARLMDARPGGHLDELGRARFRQELAEGQSEDKREAPLP